MIMAKIIIDSQVKPLPYFEGCRKLQFLLSKREFLTPIENQKVIFTKKNDKVWKSVQFLTQNFALPYSRTTSHDLYHQVSILISLRFKNLFEDIYHTYQITFVKAPVKNNKDGYFIIDLLTTSSPLDTVKEMVLSLNNFQHQIDPKQFKYHQQMSELSSYLFSLQEENHPDLERSISFVKTHLKSLTYDPD
jgi:hypothetical protein